MCVLADRCRVWHFCCLPAEFTLLSQDKAALHLLTSPSSHPCTSTFCFSSSSSSSFPSLHKFHWKCWSQKQSNWNNIFGNAIKSWSNGKLFVIIFPYMNEFVKYLLLKRWKDQHLLGSTDHMQQMPSGWCHNKLVQQLWWWCRRCFEMCGWVFVNLENQMSLLQKELKSQQLAQSLNQWKLSTKFRNCSRCTHVLYMKDRHTHCNFPHWFQPQQ